MTNYPISVFMKLYVMTPYPISVTYFIHPSQQSVYIVAMQWISKNITTSTNTQQMEELLDLSFSIMSISYTSIKENQVISSSQNVFYNIHKADLYWKVKVAPSLAKNAVTTVCKEMKGKVSYIFNLNTRWSWVLPSCSSHLILTKWSVKTNWWASFAAPEPVLSFWIKL